MRAAAENTTGALPRVRAHGQRIIRIESKSRMCASTMR